MTSYKKLLPTIAFLMIFMCGFAQVNNKAAKSYNIEQATSNRAQLHTIAFDGLAFLTGNFGADCFFPPGKVADFFGFQYMRDNDKNLMGHNTDFLTRIANNVISNLNKEQLAKLVTLANEQADLYTDFANKRMILIKAFRSALEDNVPKNSAGLNKAAVIKYCGELYRIDGELSYRRAEVMGEIIRSFSEDQKLAFNKLDIGNSDTWPILPENIDKKSMTHRAHVGVMTYASELFSWYKGNVESDVYFCPERHGTYFGGFYLKDYPAMGNHGYNISTALTGDAGKSFLEILNPQQRRLMDTLPALQKNNLAAIVKIRTQVAESLRKFMTGEKTDKAAVIADIIKYGNQDGEMSWYYANALTQIHKTLTAAQKEALKKLRNLDVLPQGTYLYSDVIPVPENLNCDFLFTGTR